MHQNFLLGMKIFLSSIKRYCFLFAIVFIKEGTKNHTIMGFSFWKCNFPINFPHVRQLVAISLLGGKLHFNAPIGDIKVTVLLS